MAEIIRIPDGNAFLLRVTGQIRTGDYTEDADFSVVTHMGVNFVRRGRIAQTFGLDSLGRIVIENSGNLAQGVYGVELYGYYHGEPWRNYQKNVFQIVNENANSDPGSDNENVLTYDVTFDVTFGGDGISAAFVEATVAAHNGDEESHPDLRDELDKKVSDVKVGGTSVVEGGVAVIDLSGKQDVIDDLSAIRSGAAAGGTAYQKPGTGIPSSDLSAEVQDKIENGGKTKSVSVNGGTPVTPDANGQVDLTIEQANVTIGTVTTGPAGSDAEVHNSGTGTAPVLDFVIPKGDDGGVGPQGPQGDSAVYNPDDPDTPDFVMANTPGQSTTKAMTQKAVTDAIQNAVDAKGLTESIIETLLACFQNVAWTTDEGQNYYDALESALYRSDEIVGIEATYTQSRTIYDIVSLNALKDDLVVKAVYGNGAKISINDYTLTGTLTAGTSEITVSYLTFTDTFEVDVTQYGTVMTYSISGGNATRYHGTYGVNTSNIQAINLDMNTRNVVLMDVGLHKMRSYPDGAYLDMYPIPVPTNATGCDLTISNGYNIGCRAYFYVDGEYYTNPEKTSKIVIYIEGGWSSGTTAHVDFGEYAGSEFYFSCNLKKTSGAVISDSDNYNLTISFTTT